MSLITTNNGRIVLKKAESTMVVPYVYDSTVGDYVLGNDVYDISSIIGDSITIEQSEANKTTKENEFKASPLIETFSGSRYAFTAQCIDLQNNVLRSIFGAMTVSGANGAAAFNDDFVPIYALVRIRFKDTNLPDVYLPKVQLNNKLFINQLKTRASQGNISGISYAMNVGVRNASGVALSQFSVPSNGGSTYTPYTPVLFVPRNRAPLFYKKHQSSALDVYSSVNFSTGSVTDVVVNPSNGILPTPGGNEGGEGGEGGGNNQGGGS